MQEWNCYARNFFLGEVTARSALSAMEITTELYRKYNIILPEVSVIPKLKDRNRIKVPFSKCTDYRVKYS